MNLNELIRHEIKVISDHYKDAKMHYEYAVAAKYAGFSDVAKEHISEGIKRLDMIKEAHKPVMALINHDKESYGDYQKGVWQGMHDCNVEDVADLRSKLEKMKAV